MKSSLRLAFFLAFPLLLALPSLAFEPSGLLEIHYINPTIQAGVTLVIGPDGTTVLLDDGKAGDVVSDYLAAIRATSEPAGLAKTCESAVSRVTFPSCT